MIPAGAKNSHQKHRLKLGSGLSRSRVSQYSRGVQDLWSELTASVNEQVSGFSRADYESFFSQADSHNIVAAILSVHTSALLGDVVSVIRNDTTSPRGLRICYGLGITRIFTSILEGRSRVILECRTMTAPLVV